MSEITNENSKTRIDLMPLNFFKAGGIYSGSIGSMRYMVKKITIDENDVLSANVWQGPYRFDVTKEEYKKEASFSLSDEGLSGASDWIGDSYDSDDRYKEKVSILDSDDRLVDDAKPMSL